MLVMTPTGHDDCRLSCLGKSVTWRMCIGLEYHVRNLAFHFKLKFNNIQVPIFYNVPNKYTTFLFCFENVPCCRDPEPNPPLPTLSHSTPFGTGLKLKNLE